MEFIHIGELLHLMQQTGKQGLIDDGGTDMGQYIRSFAQRIGERRNTKLLNRKMMHVFEATGLIFPGFLAAGAIEYGLVQLEEILSRVAIERLKQRRRQPVCSHRVEIDVGGGGGIAPLGQVRDEPSQQDLFAERQLRLIQCRQFGHDGALPLGPCRIPLEYVLEPCQQKGIALAGLSL